MLLLFLVAVAAFARPYVAGLYSTDAVDIDEFVIGRVVREDLAREVRAPGTLVPAELRWIAATVEGRVEQILVQPGERVAPDSVIMTMSNFTLARDVDTARLELEVLEAQSRVLEKRLVRDLLAQEAVVAEYESLHENARFRMEANQALGSAASRIDVREAMQQEEQFRVRLDIERQRLGHLRELQGAELQANGAEINRARRQVQLQEELLAGLTVRPGIEGVLQEVPVKPGQQITSGTLLARVARQDNFKTELRVQESQANDVLLGQKAVITAGGQSVEGEVSRIDPAVQEGTVRVDLAFTGQTLPGARPDLRVQGTIETDFAADTLVMPRPVFSRENSAIDLFVLEEGGGKAVRTSVSLGIGSVDRIQVTKGLGEGDAVIVSDTGAFAERDSIVLDD